MYTLSDLTDAFGQLGLQEGEIVQVSGDMRLVMDFEKKGGRALLEAYDHSIREQIGDTGTIVVSTASTNLCNTDTVFDPHATPSFMRGSFSEHIRKSPAAVRSFHPFQSFAAQGPRAHDLMSNASRCATGAGTPSDRLVKSHARFVSIGLHPRITCSTIHHAEHVAGVPYRYIKEFLHPVLRDGITRCEPFYMHVLYLDTGLKKNGNRKLFDMIHDNIGMHIVCLNGVNLYSYDLSLFHDAVCQAIIDDPYVLCEVPPTKRPYQS